MTTRLAFHPIWPSLLLTLLGLKSLVTDGEEQLASKYRSGGSTLDISSTQRVNQKPVRKTIEPAKVPYKGRGIEFPAIAYPSFELSPLNAPTFEYCTCLGLNLNESKQLRSIIESWMDNIKLPLKMDPEAEGRYAINDWPTEKLHLLSSLKEKITQHENFSQMADTIIQLIQGTVPIFKKSTTDFNILFTKSPENGDRNLGLEIISDHEIQKIGLGLPKDKNDEQFFPLDTIMLLKNAENYRR